MKKKCSHVVIPDFFHGFSGCERGGLKRKAGRGELTQGNTRNVQPVATRSVSPSEIVRGDCTNTLGWKEDSIGKGKGRYREGRRRGINTMKK